MSRRRDLVAFLSGMLFALGLGLSGMTDPRKVLGFLDILGEWDPTLLFVMLGAIAVHFVFAQLAGRAFRRPLFAERFVLPARGRVDAPLILGAVLFGAGWGIAGFCPGPAVASLIAFAPGTWLFVLAMVVGMLLYTLAARLVRRFARTPETSSEPTA